MSISKRLRFEVLRRDGFTCIYCGRRPPAVTLEIDHRIPRAAGGDDSRNNLVSACWDCNRGKGPIDVRDGLLYPIEREYQVECAGVDGAALHDNYWPFPEWMVLKTRGMPAVDIAAIEEMMPYAAAEDRMSIDAVMHLARAFTEVES